VTHSPYARAPDLSVTLPRIAVQYLTLIFHQHTEAKDVITSKVSASAITMISLQNVTRSSLCAGVKGCGTKRAYNFFFPKSSFRIRRTTVLGMFKDSAIVLDAIRRSFFTKLATAAMFT
jgi:hypothetical protein